MNHFFIMQYLFPNKYFSYTQRLNSMWTSRFYKYVRLDTIQLENNTLQYSNKPRPQKLI